MDTNYTFDQWVWKLDQGDVAANSQWDQYCAQYGSRFYAMLDESRIRIYYNAACAGDQKARYWMGVSYARTNPDVAQQWLQPLLDKNNMSSIRVMQMCYAGAAGCTGDPAKYEYWLTLGAKLGDLGSQISLADHYYIHALESTTFNQKWQLLLQAETWYIEATKQRSQRGAIGVLKVCDEFENGMMAQFRFSNSNQRLNYAFVKECVNNSNPSTNEEAQIKDTFLDWFDERMWACDVAMHCQCEQDEMRNMYVAMGAFYRNSQSYMPDLLNVKRGIYCFYQAGQYGDSLGLRNSREMARDYGVWFDESNPEGWKIRERLFD